jgi:hypothetical protein
MTWSLRLGAIRLKSRPASPSIIPGGIGLLPQLASRKDKRRLFAKIVVTRDGLLTRPYR